MNTFAELTQPADSGERLVGILATLAIAAYAMVAFIRWCLRGQAKPDPWPEEIAAEIADDRAPALCHHCMEPHDSSVYFCPDCGAPVGTYVNFLPYPQLFSVGFVLRIGTFGAFKRSWINVAGFVLLGLIQYVVFAPAYWFMLMRNLSHRRALPPSPESSQTDQPQPS
jgi:hypothetical protein